MSETSFLKYTYAVCNACLRLVIKLAVGQIIENDSDNNKNCSTTK